MPSNELFQPQNNGDMSVAKSGTMPKTSVAGHENLDMCSFGTQYGQIQFPHLRPTPGGWTNHLFFLCSLAQKSTRLFEVLGFWPPNPQHFGNLGNVTVQFRKERNVDVFSSRCFWFSKNRWDRWKNVSPPNRRKNAHTNTTIPLFCTTYSPCLLGGNYFIPAAHRLYGNQKQLLMLTSTLQGYLEDHPRMSVVNNHGDIWWSLLSPKDRVVGVVGPLPNGRTSRLVNGGY